MNIDDLHKHFTHFFPTSENESYINAYDAGDIDGMIDVVSCCHDPNTCIICSCFI